MHNNRGKQVYAEPKGPTLVKPFEYVHVDLMEMDKSSEGHTAILALIDYFSRFVALKPLLTKEKQEVAKALLDCFLSYSFPRTIKSDNGSEFVNKLLVEMLDNFKVSQVRSIAYDHHANGLVERAIGTARVMLQTFRESLKKSINKDKWNELLPFVQFGMNCRVNAITKRTPHLLVFGRNPFNYNGEMRNLFGEEAADNRAAFWKAFDKAIPKELYDLRLTKFLNTKYPHHAGEFQVGEYVMKRKDIRAGKHDTVFEGPYKIIEELDNGHYRIVAGDNELIQPANMLKRSGNLPPIDKFGDAIMGKQSVDKNTGEEMEVDIDLTIGRNEPEPKPIENSDAVNDTLSQAVNDNSNDNEDSHAERRRRNREMASEKRTSGRINLSGLEDLSGYDNKRDKSYTTRQNGRGRKRGASK